MKLKLTSKSNAEAHGVPVNSVIDIDIEDYLLGVVPAEIGNAPIEACKAQAVASRTAAYPYYSKDKVLTDASSMLQAYSATRTKNLAAYPNAMAAVEKTRGELLWYNGSVITTCSYCNSNGGRTTSSKERWGGERAWLIAQDDPWDAAVSKGVRSGHGVGMSQTGAKYAAGIGKDYKAILAFYYPHTELKKEGITMAKTCSSADFVAKANYINKTYTVKYKLGKSGQFVDGVYQCDCRGFIMWILRLLGISAAITGTNYMIRKQMREVHEVSSASQLKVGQVVFKSKNDKTDLPGRYWKGGADYSERFGEIDVFHVGVVVQTSPTLIIRHCSGGGIRTDTKLGAWNWAGWAAWVTEGGNTTPAKEAPQKATEPQKTASNGSTGVVNANKVNLRKSPSTKAYRLEYLNTGDKVHILKVEQDWLYVKGKTRDGYVMSKFVNVL